MTLKAVFVSSDCTVGETEASAGNHRNTAWAGSVFSSDGRVLFVNRYNGVTPAITDPFDRGTL